VSPTKRTVMRTDRRNRRTPVVPSVATAVGIAVCGALVVQADTPAQVSTYVIVAVDPLGGAEAINDVGQVVGQASVGGPTGFAVHGMVWKDGR